MIETRTLGRTGLSVSILGLGGGGNSRLGLSTGKDITHAADVVRAALDLGVTMIDTARGYGTESAVGQAIKGRNRAGVVISSKSHYLDDKRELLSPQAFEDNLNTSLREMNLETIDIYFIHALNTMFYDRARESLMPVLQRAKRDGKIRFIGVTEGFESDTRHEMLQRAVQDDDWDVMMVGFNLLNPTAAERVFPITRQKGIGTLGMFAVRRALIDEAYLRTVLQRLAGDGLIDPDLPIASDLMQALHLNGVSQSFSEAAYRFAAFSPGMDCVLSGTSSPDHLRENLQAVERGALPPAVLEHLHRLFSQVDTISGQVRTV